MMKDPKDLLKLTLIYTINVYEVESVETLIHFALPLHVRLTRIEMILSHFRSAVTM